MVAVVVVRVVVVGAAAELGVLAVVLVEVQVEEVVPAEVQAAAVALAGALVAAAQAQEAVRVAQEAVLARVLEVARALGPVALVVEEEADRLTAAMAAVMPSAIADGRSASK